MKLGCHNLLTSQPSGLPGDQSKLLKTHLVVPFHSFIVQVSIAFHPACTSASRVVSPGRAQLPKN